MCPLTWSGYLYGLNCNQTPSDDQDYWFNVYIAFIYLYLYIGHKQKTMLRRTRRSLPKLIAIHLVAFNKCLSKPRISTCW